MPRGQSRPPAPTLPTAPRSAPGTRALRIVRPCCAGPGARKKAVTACVRRVRDDGGFARQTRTFATATPALLAPGDRLAGEGVRQAAMGSTGVCWKPAFHTLEDRFEVVPVDAQHVKRVPGRETGVKDADWIAGLLRHGPLAASFIPPPPTRGPRDLTRQRARLVGERATAADRVQKALEGADVKSAGVASDTLGVSRPGDDRRPGRPRGVG